MADIRIKRRLTGAATAPTTLRNAEIAFNEVNETLYYGKGDDGNGNATSVIAIGGSGALSTAAEKLATPRNIALTGDVTGSVLFDGSADVSIAATIPANSIANADLTQVATAILKGRVTAGTGSVEDLTAAQVRTLLNVADGATNLALASTAPAALGTAAVGVGTTAARADHVHAMPTLTQVGNATADRSMSGFKITSLADPVSSQDAATKAYVDSLAQGLDPKASVKAATTANVTLSAAQTIDGVALVAGDRVLVKNQTAGAENGIYVVAAGAWTRSTDADSATKLTSGAFTFVEQGTVNADTGWTMVTDGTITLGTTSLAFTQFSGAGAYTASNGIARVVADFQLTGQALAVHNLATNGSIHRTAAGTIVARTLAGVANRTTVTNGDGVAGNPTVDIASTYVGQTSITTLGTVATGTWNATAIGLAKGGTGADLSAATDGTMFKKVGTVFVAAVAGTDYLSSSSTIDGGTF